MIKFGQYKVEEGAGEKLIELNRKTCEDEPESSSSVFADLCRK